MENTKPFPPTHLFADLTALAAHVIANPNGGEVKVVPVSQQHIHDMEAVAGFAIPKPFADFYAANGSLLYTSDELVVAASCYNEEGRFANHLYGYLAYNQAVLGTSFNITKEEQEYLQLCWWVLGVAVHNEEQWLFVSNAKQEVKIIHFGEVLFSMSDHDFEDALQPVLDSAVRQSLQDFMNTAAYRIAAENLTKPAEPQSTATEEDPEKEKAEREHREKAETQAFLDKHNLKKVTYEEVLEKLNVDQLFDYWNGEESHAKLYDYDSEREYFDGGRIYYCDGDLTIDGNLTIPHVNFLLLVVKGNMTVNGKVPSPLNDPTPYYVAGNTTTDYIQLGAFQKTAGTETVRCVAAAWGQDDETTHQMPSRHINAPYFFSWFYDLNCFTFEPHVIVIALYDYNELSKYKTDALVLAWHEYAYAFNPDLLYTVEESHHDMLALEPDSIYKALQRGESPLRDGVTPEGLRLLYEGIKLKHQDDTVGAYLTFKEAIAKSPGHYLLYYHAGMCLSDNNAYAQAKEVLLQGAALTPVKLKYEFACMEEAAWCAVRIGDYDTAMTWAMKAIEKRSTASFALRVVGEVLIHQGKLDEARNYLEKSYGIHAIFSTTWLLGLVHHFQGDSKKAAKYFNESATYYDGAQPYTEQTDLRYVHGDGVTVDWDTRAHTPLVKDQAYWDTFFADVLANYGPDLYTRTGQFPTEWLAGRIDPIPQEHRTQAMLISLLDHQTNGEYDVKGQVIQHFSSALYTEAILIKAVTRPDPCGLHNIPAVHISEAILEAHTGGIDLRYVPTELLTYDRCHRAVIQNQFNYNYLPAAFRDERMTIALIAGGGLQDTHAKDLPSRYYTAGYINQAIDLGINVIKKIPAQRVTQEVYQHAIDKYGTDPEWPFIVEQFDRDRWQYGDAYRVEMMGKAVRKYGITIFDHINVKAVDRAVYAYYKKHLGHLPEFDAKAKAHGWDEQIKTTERDSSEPEVTSGIFKLVWACFWDEDFIAKAVTDKESPERLYNLPEQYRTQRICELVLKRSLSDFPFVPKAVMTQAMVEGACKYTSDALEYVPLAMRTASACEAAIATAEENIKFIPIRLRTTDLLVNVIRRETSLYAYVPHNQYAEVFGILFKKHKRNFANDFLLTHWGIGLILAKDYDGARKKLAAVEKESDPYASNLHKAAYYTGWSYFLEGNAVQADVYWKKAQALLTENEIDEKHHHTFTYEAFQLPPVPDVYDFSQGDFDNQMHEATLLIQQKSFAPALDIVTAAEKQLADAQCSEMRLWAYLWDYKRYALYEAGHKEEAFACCRNTVAKLSTLTLWPYLDEFNPIRAALRAAHNTLAYHHYETATDLAGVKEGIAHSKAALRTIAPIEDTDVLNLFYETYALLLHKATTFDKQYQKDLDNVVARIKTLKLKEAGVLTEELLSKVTLS